MNDKTDWVTEVIKGATELLGEDPVTAMEPFGGRDNVVLFAVEMFIQGQRLGKTPLDMVLVGVMGGIYLERRRAEQVAALEAMAGEPGEEPTS